MKLPPSHQINQKLQNPTTNNIITINSSYEPNSVLDLHCSPTYGDHKLDASGLPDDAFMHSGDQKSDASGLPDDAFMHSGDQKSDASGLPDDAFMHLAQWGDHHIPNNFDDLESLMRYGGGEDESKFNLSKPPPEFPLYHSFDSAIAQFIPSDLSFLSSSSDSNSNSNINLNLLCNLWGDFTTAQLGNVGFLFLDDLIRAADFIESNQFQLASGILSRLNHHQLRSPVGQPPLLRAAFYFKQAMQQSLLLTAETTTATMIPSSSTVDAIKAYKSFSNISPIPMFSNFTANQAILDAVGVGSRLIHVVDFEIGFGGQWASFMRELVDSSNSPPVVLRITAVVPEDYGLESRLIRDSLNQFAGELRIGFRIDFVSITTFEYLSFKSIGIVDGEKTAVVLSPSLFQRTDPGFFLDHIREISPCVVVLVDDAGGFTGPPSLTQTLIHGLEFFSALLESLEAAGDWGGIEDSLQEIETFLLCPKITAAIEAAAGSRTLPPWREAFAATGMKPVALSQFAEFQAEFLLRKVQVRGFHVAKRQAELALCWQERALVATSAWRC